MLNSLGVVLDKLTSIMYFLKRQIRGCARIDLFEMPN